MKVIRSIVLMCLGALLPLPSRAQTIVWTDLSARRIQAKDVNGGEVQTIVQFSFPQNAYLIHYDPIGAELYYNFSDDETWAFRRCNLDGSEQETIATPNAEFVFGLNVELRKLYWREDSSCWILLHSALNGAGVESRAYCPACCLAALEGIGGDLFFATQGSPKGVWRADADGSNETLLNGNMLPYDLAFDPVEKKIYVGDIQRIDRLNTDGTGFEFVVEHLNSDAEHVEVDYTARKLYWVDRDSNGVSRIQRSNLDGSNVEVFVSGVGNSIVGVGGLTIVYPPPPIPTLSGWGVMAMTVLILSAGLFVLKKRFSCRRSREACANGIVSHVGFEYTATP